MISEKNRVNAQKNEIPHHLGSKGYAQRQEQWQASVESSMSSGDGTFLGIRDRRCINWLMARVTFRKDGTIIYNSPKVEAAAQRMVSNCIFIYIYFNFQMFAYFKH